MAKQNKPANEDRRAALCSLRPVKMMIIRVMMVIEMVGDIDTLHVSLQCI